MHQLNGQKFVQGFINQALPLIPIGHVIFLFPSSLSLRLSGWVATIFPLTPGGLCFPPAALRCTCPNKEFQTSIRLRGHCLQTFVDRTGEITLCEAPCLAIILYVHVMLFCTFFFIALYQITEDLNVDPEADSDHFMILIIESLSLLGKIPEALEVHCPSNVKPWKMGQHHNLWSAKEFRIGTKKKME